MAYWRGSWRAADGDEEEDADGDGRRTPAVPIPPHTHIPLARARAPPDANLVTGVRFPPASGVPVGTQNGGTSTRRAPAARLAVPPLGGPPSVACAS